MALSDILDIFAVKKSAEPNDEVRLSEELLEEYYNERLPWVQQAKADEDFRMGAQWTAAEKEELLAKGHSPIVVNVIHPNVELAKALLTTHTPKFMVTAEEDSDTDIAGIMNDILSYIWNKSNGNVELKQVIDDLYVKGVGYFLVYFEPNVDLNGGEIYIRAIDPYHVYVDPNSKDVFLRDAAHIIISSVFTLEQLLNTYPDILPKLNELKQSFGDRRPVTKYLGETGQHETVTFTNRDKYYEVIDRYTKIKQVIVAIKDNNLGSEREFTDEEFQEFLNTEVIIIKAQDTVKVLTAVSDINYYKQVIEQMGNVVHYELNPVTQEPELVSGDESQSQNALPNSTMEIEVATVQDVIDTEYSPFVYNIALRTRVKRVLSIGGIEYYTEIMPITEYPIVPFFNYHNRNPYPMSDVRFIRPIQEMINKIRSLIIAHASNSTSVKVLVPKGSIDKQEFLREWAKAGPALLEVDFEFGQPVIVGPVPLPTELYRTDMDLQKTVQDILGIYAISQGDVSLAPNTYGGILAIDDYAQRRIKSKLSDIENALSHLGNIVIQFVQKYLTEEKVIRIVTPDGQQKQTIINQNQYNPAGILIGRLNDVSIGRYDVRVVSGSTLPSNRWAMMDYYIKLYQLGLVDRETVLRKSEIPNVNEVLARISEIENLKQQLAMAAEQMKNMESKLKSAESNEMYARKIAELSKFESDVEKIKNDMKSTVKELANKSKK